jgi:putative transposase
MTNEMMSLYAMIENTDNADVLRDRLMELEVERKTGARYGEKSSERLAQRNGYRDRSWETRAGTIELRIPKLRKGNYFLAFLEPGGWPRRRSRRWFRKPMCRASRPARSTIWSRPWG